LASSEPSAGVSSVEKTTASIVDVYVDRWCRY
jgi:hypothetical protein